jgi:transposase
VNTADFALRGVAYSGPWVGRPDYFAGSDDGRGDRAAAIDHLISTAKLNGLSPEAYLRHVPEGIADPAINKRDELLPWNLLTQVPSLQIAA